MSAVMTDGRAPLSTAWCGDAIAEMERISAEKLPPQIGYQWSGVTFQQLKAGNETPFIFSMALIFIFLVTSADSGTFVVSMMTTEDLTLL